MFAVPVGAAGEKFLKFDTFSCVFKAFFRFPFPVREGVGELHSKSPPLATPISLCRGKFLREWKNFPKHI